MGNGQIIEIKRVACPMIMTPQGPMLCLQEDCSWYMGRAEACAIALIGTAAAVVMADENEGGLESDGSNTGCDRASERSADESERAGERP
jgi:hypothetical protein